ncbi:superkiller protein 3 [[Candida] anglica]|uniref:Superkiller protein 3 n=1 Tax=[Candida] anglica TaxID=148631 RepID=A0ABP0ECL2_9ASCO
MSSLKKCLKQAKTYIEANDPESALEYIDDALEYDPQNYFALIFQGKSYQLLDDLNLAATSFAKATEIEPDNLLGWKGYFQIAKSGDNFELFFKVLASFLQTQMDQNLPLAETIKDAKNYLVYHNFKSNSGLYEKYLRSLLPEGGELSEFSGLFISPLAEVYKQLIDLIAKQERAKVNDLVGKEKLRLPRNMTAEHKARLNNVKWTVYRTSDLSQLYESFINICNDDEVRSTYEEELLKYKYELLLSAPSKEKIQKELQELVEGMVVVKHKSLLCWSLYFDWKDVKSLADLELDSVIYFLKTFPTEGLGMVLYAFVMSDLSPFDRKKILKELSKGNEKKNKKNKSASDEENDDDIELQKLETQETEQSDEEMVALSSEVNPKQTLTILTEGFDLCPQSIFASRIVCNYYIHLREYEEGSLRCRDSIRLLADLQRSTGVDLVNTREDVLCSLAMIYTYYEAPKNFGKALQLYDRILIDNPQNVQALVGKGLILVEKDQLIDAKDLLQNVVTAFPQNIQAKSELSWCLVRLGDVEAGRKGLEECVNQIKGADLHSGETRAILYWRIAESYKGHDSHAEVYSCLIQSLKESKNFAPSYTSLGVLYNNSYNDKARAQKCFYKAFELDVGEITAARYLVEELSSNNEWDVAEVLCKRIVSTERSRRKLLGTSTSKTDDNSWPYRVLGCSALNKQEDDKAVEWFQTALRMTSMDVQCWIGLGEAYFNCGRLDAAAKVLRHTLTEDNWVVQYMLGVVVSEMGSFDEATLHLNNALKLRENEECIVYALYQCKINHAVALVSGGFYGRATESVLTAVKYIQQAVSINKTSQSLWKALGDCLRVFMIVKAEELPIEELKIILESIEIDKSNAFMEELSEIEMAGVDATASNTSEDYIGVVSEFTIRTAKNAVYVLPNKSNKLLRSMVYYNLGLAYLEGYKTTFKSSFRDASIKALKKAIQLEGNNATYWVSLGNAFTSTNPQIAQHCFIKATSLETRDADVWTNLAALYLRYGDHELAEEAFLRASSVAPQQPQSWLGHALAAQNSGKTNDASRLFTHAYILANGRSPLAQLLYGLSVLQARLHTGCDPRDVEAAQEFSIANFAMTNYIKNSPHDELGLTVALTISERCQDYETGIDIGNRLADMMEREYENSESDVALTKFAQAKASVGRMYLGVGDYEKALENAQFALSIVEEEEGSEFDTLVLSARITIGLSFFFNDQFDDALEQLKYILTKRSDSQRIVTLTAQILYTYNNEETKQAAIDQLFAHIEEFGSSLLVVLTLGAISIVDNLDEYMGAIREELQGLSLQELVEDNVRVVPQLISEINNRLDQNTEDVRTWQRSAVLFPQDYNIWKRINSRMALQVATLDDSKLTASETSNAYKEIGKLRSIQRSLVLNPENVEAKKALLSFL